MSPGILKGSRREKGVITDRMESGGRGQGKGHSFDPSSLICMGFLARNYWLISERIKMKQNVK